MGFCLCAVRRREREEAVPVVSLRCSGCSWRAASNTLDGLNELAREHDDSPRARHIVTLDPARGWPENETEFRELLAQEKAAADA